jgi:hypothetical protein
VSHASLLVLLKKSSTNAAMCMFVVSQILEVYQKFIELKKFPKNSELGPTFTKILLLG